MLCVAQKHESSNEGPSQPSPWPSAVGSCSWPSSGTVLATVINGEALTLLLGFEPLNKPCSTLQLLLILTLVDAACKSLSWSQTQQPSPESSAVW